VEGGVGVASVRGMEVAAAAGGTADAGWVTAVSGVGAASTVEIGAMGLMFAMTEVGS